MTWRTIPLLICLLQAAACGDDDADPGALVSISVDGQVGVLLDDYPEASRERVTAAVLAMDDAFWEERVRRQLRLANLRLVYRNLYYEESENKNALPLPPEPVWTIELSTPGLATVDGHELVAVDYTMTSALLSDADSPQVSEVALGAPGGTWDEEFVLPVDPTMILQRTGYACIDEDQFPPESVDSENAYQFYDDYCEVETADTVVCHYTTLPDQSCIEAVQASVGSVDVAIHYERVAWDEAVAATVRHGEVTTPEAPDLSVVVDGYHQSLSNNRVVYKYFEPTHCAVLEGCVGAPGWRRLIAFDSMDHNQGGVALHIGEVDYYAEGLFTELADHGVYELSECHNHYHFQYYGDFGFGDGSDQAVQKNGFCIESTSRLSNNESTPLHTDYVCENQGLSPGWGDLYAAGLICNWVDVTGVDTSAGAVTEDLFFHSNPDGFLCEGELVTVDGEQQWEETEFRTATGDVVSRPACDEAAGTEGNDLGEVSVTLPEEGGLLTSACRDEQALGPLRNCGFAVQATLPTCTPGAETTITCSGGDAEHPQAIRLCEASIAMGRPIDCLFENSLATAVVAGADVDVTFTCPAPRDTLEVGGQYAIYSAPAWAPDGPMTVTCN